MHSLGFSIRRLVQWLTPALVMTLSAMMLACGTQGDDGIDIKIDGTPAPAPPTAEQLVEQNDVIVTGRVVEVLPSRWTTRLADRPENVGRSVPDEYTIITPVILEVDGPPLADRVGIFVRDNRIVIATIGGTVGDDRITAGPPFAIGERVLVGVSGFIPSVVMAEGTVWHVGARYALSSEGMATAVPNDGNWSAQRSADLIASITNAGKVSSQ